MVAGSSWLRRVPCTMVRNGENDRNVREVWQTARDA